MKNSPDHNRKKKFKSKNHFLIHYALSESSKIFWPKEIKLSKKLLELFPNLNFWRDIAFTIFHKKPNSLTAYLASDNLKALSVSYHNYEKLKDLDFSSRKRYTLEEEKVGEDREYEKKDKNILDFINNGKKKENRDSSEL